MSRSRLRPSFLLPVSLCLFWFGCAGDTDSPAGSGGTGGRGGAGGSNPGQGGSGGTGPTGSGGTAPGNTGGSGGGVGPATGGAGGGTGGSTTGGSGGGSGSDGPVGLDTAGSEAAPGARFSFFVTSLEAMRRLSKSQNGFGGDLRYGEADGLRGADKICTEIAESVASGSGAKGWRAFLSAPAAGGQPAVNAIDRIGQGPWFDARQRMVAATKADLLFNRPRGADPAIANDLPNEFGVPNHRPDPGMPAVDNHHFLTGSDAMGRLYGPTATCAGWTTSASNAGRPRIGFSWPAAGRVNWISGQDEGGCGAGVNIFGSGGSDPSNPIVGSGGGYGGIYCFALQP